MILITTLERKQSELIEMVSERHPNIRVLSNYEHCKKPVKCYCNKHNYYFETTPRQLGRSKENGGCPFCIKERGDSTIRLTQEEFIERVKKKNPNVQIIGKYYNNSTKIECYCDRHNYTWMADPKVLLDGSGCKKCGIEKSSLSRTRTQEEFENRLSKIFPNIKVIGKYSNALEKIKCYCEIHRYYWEATPGSLLWGEGCPQCGRDSRTQKQTLTNEEYATRVNDVNPWIKLISQYQGITGKIDCQCKNCGGRFTYQARTIISPINCPVCTNQITNVGLNDLATTHPFIVKYFKDPTDAYRYRYNSTQKVMFKCPICGDEKELNIAQTISNGYHCMYCDKGVSIPNRIIRNLLRLVDAKNRQFEYSPDWAGRYRYDAYFEYNDVPYIVEMDGGYHFSSNSKYRNDEERYKKQIEADRAKDLLANEHGITMIRIKCVPNTLQNISKQLKYSLLSTMFDLESIDWRGLLYYDNTLLKEICECYNALEKKSATAVSGILKINRKTISNYLYRGTDLGMCNYTPTIKIIA